MFCIWNLPSGCLLALSVVDFTNTWLFLQCYPVANSNNFLYNMVVHSFCGWLFLSYLCSAGNRYFWWVYIFYFLLDSFFFWKEVLMSKMLRRKLFWNIDFLEFQYVDVHLHCQRIMGGYSIYLQSTVRMM